MTILAVGPRKLPERGTVEVWFDTGSGARGQRATVSVQRLTLADLDRGEGTTALYEYQPYHCWG
ncbi:hypothetical protein [Micromonospora cathayae]|uniref:Uncharacterized protein n=1 Tax=Micromonospora cathayae TaxID=3028804 RepID=A0ABY7ZS92_9ACTN|nr:hypothetical protein [Micromonospora sp. HUAS 3]WDZ85651.1 hypothetical protein PVK37_04155 [Micromonospora sp. HUAS 3]